MNKTKFIVGLEHASDIESFIMPKHEWCYGFMVVYKPRIFFLVWIWSSITKVVHFDHSKVSKTTFFSETSEKNITKIHEHINLISSSLSCWIVQSMLIFFIKSSSRSKFCVSLWSQKKSLTTTHKWKNGFLPSMF